MFAAPPSLIFKLQKVTQRSLSLSFFSNSVSFASSLSLSLSFRCPHLTQFFACYFVCEWFPLCALINFVTLFFKLLQVRRCKIRSFTPQVAIICLTVYHSPSLSFSHCAPGDVIVLAAALANHQTKERANGLHSKQEAVEYFDGEHTHTHTHTRT